MVDFLFPVPVDCLATASASLGSICGTNTTANVDKKVRGLVHLMLTSPAFHLA